MLDHTGISNQEVLPDLSIIFLQVSAFYRQKIKNKVKKFSFSLFTRYPCCRQVKYCSISDEKMKLVILLVFLAQSAIASNSTCQLRSLIHEKQSK